MPAPAGGVTKDSAGAAARLPRVLLAGALLAQVAIGLSREVMFLARLSQAKDDLEGAGGGPAGSSVWLVAALLAASALWARHGHETSALARMAIAGLVHVAALGLALYVTVAVTGRFSSGVAPVLLASSLLVALRKKPRPRAEPRDRLFEPPLSPWDALSAVVLLAVLATTVFPYAEYDAKYLWACRAAGLRPMGLVAGLTACLMPHYPPLYSLLLALGVRDPLFQGRLLPAVTLVLFALFLRGRLGRVSGAAPAALLFLLATVNVCLGAAAYAANVPLMIFLSAGTLLVLGLPAGGESASRGERTAGAVCLAAAALVRPDGPYYMGVVVLAVLLAPGRRRITRLWPWLLAGGAALSWTFRPEGLRSGPTFFLNPTGEWRTVAPSPVHAAAVLLETFFQGWQGQWFSHYGLGLAIWTLAGMALLDLRTPRAREPDSTREEKGFFRRVTAGSLLAVMLCFAALPFVGDPTAGVRHDLQRPYLLHYLTFIRLGLGRMTVHLYPFFAFYALSVFRGIQGPAWRRIQTA